MPESRKSRSNDIRDVQRGWPYASLDKRAKPYPGIPKNRRNEYVRFDEQERARREAAEIGRPAISRTTHINLVSTETIPITGSEASTAKPASNIQSAENSTQTNEIRPSQAEAAEDALDLPLVASGL